MFIDHAAVYVEDLERGACFYEQYFDGVRGERYENPRTGFSSYFITFDGGNTRLEVMHNDAIARPVDRGARGYAPSRSTSARESAWMNSPRSSWRTDMRKSAVRASPETAIAKAAFWMRKATLWRSPAERTDSQRILRLLYRNAKSGVGTM
ncbi:VOC family protein [Bifidobacterium pseudolongum]|uniref:VOC family protein n=1 Tax=Bifidobacterium pseudolongum TaxID=1694 RepID=UPI0010D93C4B|nr:VOC family protein [Bifidobacterium pseudolongum]RYQ02261.1 glyoxalase [Bifidobacterium pseudolongum subsp. globosum]RYQ06448.1 glyoxalase [Bifidobacterium pseudolongum subsp. globosum]RYQ13243.1 glyoxalase [Bifidobacterium pseudolongum subsp. globosum]